MRVRRVNTEWPCCAAERVFAGGLAAVTPGAKVALAVGSMTSRSPRGHVLSDLHLLSKRARTRFCTAIVRRVAREFRERHGRLDVLFNNAGALFTSRQTTPDGLERTFALNHLAYFVLTVELLDLLGTAYERLADFIFPSNQVFKSAAFEMRQRKLLATATEVTLSLAGGYAQVSGDMSVTRIRIFFPDNYRWR